MRVKSNSRKRLAALLDEVAVDEGIHPTPVDGVLVARNTEPRPRTPAIYEPMIVFIGQGRKRAHLGDETFVYDPLHYLVLPVPLPVECEWKASPEEPMLLTAILLEPTMLGEIILEMDESLPPLESLPRGMATPEMTEELADAVCRLVECLKCSLDSRILGRQMVREIIYRILRGEQGGALRALANRDEHFMRVARVLKRIHTECAQPLSVEQMAKQARMSVAAFHSNFKQVTGNSPIQYLKRIRLDRARRLMAHDGYNASMAASAVGYESPSQFSREFKRLFGATPVEEAEQARTRIDAG